MSDHASSNDSDDDDMPELPRAALNEFTPLPTAESNATDDSENSGSTSSGSSGTSSPMISQSRSRSVSTSPVTEHSMKVVTSQLSRDTGKLSLTEKEQFQRQFQNIQGQMSAERAAMAVDKAAASRRTRERVLQRRQSRQNMDVGSPQADELQAQAPASQDSSGAGGLDVEHEHATTKTRQRVEQRRLDRERDKMEPTPDADAARGGGGSKEASAPDGENGTLEPQDVYLKPGMFHEEENVPVNKMITKELERRRAARQERLQGFLSEFEREKLQNESQMDLLRNMMALEGYDVSVPGLEKEQAEKVLNEGREVMGLKLPGLKNMTDEELDKMEAIMEKIQATRKEEKERASLREINQQKMDKLRQEMAKKEKRVAELRAEQTRVLRQQRLQKLKAARAADGLPDLPEEDLEAELEDDEEEDNTAAAEEATDPEQVEANMEDAVKMMNSLNADMEDDEDIDGDDADETAMLESLERDGTGAQTADEAYAKLKAQRRKNFERLKSVRRDFYRACMPSYVLSHNYPQAYKAALSQKMKGASCFRKGQEYQAIQHFMEGMLQLVEGIPIFAIEEEILQDEEIPLTDALMSNIVAAMVKPRVKEPVTAALYATFILQRDPDNVKIRFRRARAHVMLQLFGLASEDLGLCERAALGEGFSPPPAGIDSDSVWRAAYARADSLADAVSDDATAKQRRKRQSAELLGLRLGLCAKSREISRADADASAAESDSAGESEGEVEDKGHQAQSRMFLPPHFKAICRRLRDAETVRHSRRFLSARVNSRRLRNEIACCCIHMYSMGHWQSFSTCLGIISTLVRQLGLDSEPTGFIMSDFLRVVSLEWSTKEQAHLCWSVALPALLGGPDLPKATSGNALERSNAWLEVARFFQRFMGFVWPARRVHKFLDFVARGFDGGKTVWSRDVRREVRAYVMPMYRRHRQDSHHHMWRRYFHHEQLRMSQGRKKQGLVGENGDRACSVPFGKISGSPVEYTTAAWRASQAQLSADREAWRSGLQPWQVASFHHEGKSDEERIADTMSEPAIATLYGPVGWGGPGVLDTLRLHAVASAALQLNAVIQIERHEPSNPMYQYMVSPLHLWAWRGEDLVVDFLLQHGQMDFIDKLDGGFFGTPATPLDFVLAHKQKVKQCISVWERLEGNKDVYQVDGHEIRSVAEDRKTLEKLDKVERLLRSHGAKCASELGERFDDVGMLD